MKRTIRKKIMSDLQHAFVRRPDRDGIEIQSLDAQGALQPNVLDLLRDSDDSGLDSPTRRRRGRRLGNIGTSKVFNLDKLDRGKYSEFLST